jgi:peptidoglycan hydrolase CwlO-like protein
MNITTYISIASLFVALYVAVTNSKRSMTHDERQASERMTTVIVKLENIGNGVNEIKADIRNIKSDVQELRERVVAVEQSTKTLHKRVDEVEGKL